MLFVVVECIGVAHVLWIRVSCRVKTMDFIHISFPCRVGIRRHRQHFAPLLKLRRYNVPHILHLVWKILILDLLRHLWVLIQICWISYMVVYFLLVNMLRIATMLRLAIGMDLLWENPWLITLLMSSGVRKESQCPQLWVNLIEKPSVLCTLL